MNALENLFRVIWSTIKGRSSVVLTRTEPHPNNKHDLLLIDTYGADIEVSTYSVIGGTTVKYSMPQALVYDYKDSNEKEISLSIQCNEVFEFPLPTWISFWSSFDKNLKQDFFPCKNILVTKDEYRHRVIHINLPDCELKEHS
jgi:hypothetical protein